MHQQEQALQPDDCVDKLKSEFFETLLNLDQPNYIGPQQQDFIGPLKQLLLTNQVQPKVQMLLDTEINPDFVSQNNLSSTISLSRESTNITQAPSPVESSSSSSSSSSDTDDEQYHSKRIKITRQITKSKKVK